MRHLQNTLSILMTGLCFLLPLKFGGLAVMPESGGFYPENISGWLIVTFPPHSLGIFGAVMLLLAAIACKCELPRKYAAFSVWWCVIPVIAALPGIINGHAGENWGEVTNLLGMGTFSAAGALLIAADESNGKKFAGALLLGGLYAAVYGIYQHFAGLDELRQFAAEQMRAGLTIPKALKLKLTDPRIFSTLASSNTLASLMMILMPVACFFACRWGNCFEPRKVSQKLFLLIMLAALGWALFLTSSRSALLCPALAALLAILSHRKIAIKYRIIAVVAVVLLLTGGVVFAIHCGRGTASMAERADYLRSCAILTVKHPLCGAGWGNFFRTHMSIKLSDTDESARDPHNVTAAFASQAGIPAGVLILSVLLLPLLHLWRYRFTPGFPMAVFWSGVIFTLHSLMDCDWHVPALPAAMGILYLAAYRKTAPPEENRNVPHWQVLTVICILCVLSAAGNIHYLRGDRALARLTDRLMPASAEQAAALAHLPIPELIREAEILRPRSALIQQLAGDWYYHCGDRVTAEKYYHHAAKLDPQRPGIWAKLARVAAVKGNREAAVGFMQRAHRIFPKNPKYDVQRFIAEELQ